MTKFLFIYVLTLKIYLLKEHFTPDEDLDITLLV